MKNAVQLIKQCSIVYAESDKKIAQDTLLLYNALFKDVYYASNGVDALNLYNKHKDHVDLIITDIHLDKLSGIEMVKRLRSDVGYKLPVVFSMNSTSDEILLQCLKLGTSDYILKPIQHKTHLGILIKVLRPIYDIKLQYVLNEELEIYRKSANSQLLISKTDTKGKITYANELFYQVSGYSEDEILGKSHSIVRHPNTPDAVFKELWETILQGKVWSGHIENQAKDGTSYFVDAKIFPIKDNEGNIVEFMSFRQNVTVHVMANKKAKDALKQTKLSYSKVYDEAIEKAKIYLAKDLENYEMAAQLERDKARAENQKRAQLEKMLEETTKRKDEEIKKWKDKLKEAGRVLASISSNNKRISKDVVYFKNELEVTSEKLEASQKTVANYDEDKKVLYKRIEDKDDVIKHLEEELMKYKGKKF
jgi:PAS domain S-box-containing protein